MAEITLLDGGMGQELLARSGDAPTRFWATQVMIDHPGMVADIHRDYFAAGSTIATANTYAILRDRFEGTEYEGREAELIALALDEARSAKSQPRHRIAGSLGPLRASYRPDLHPAGKEAVALYSELARWVAPGVDLILCETVASVAHARDVLDGARSADKPVWVAVTLDDEDGRFLRSGEPVTELTGLEPDAWLANCSAPEAMPAALEVFARFGKPFGCYANGFEEITKEFLKPNPTADALSQRRDMGPEIYADHAADWVDMGATVIGGCCEIGPAHIARVADRLTALGHALV